MEFYVIYWGKMNIFGEAKSLKKERFAAYQKINILCLFLTLCHQNLVVLGVKKSLNINRRSHEMRL